MAGVRGGKIAQSTLEIKRTRYVAWGHEGKALLHRSIWLAWKSWTALKGSES
jgi:hypothetical protein